MQSPCLGCNNEHGDKNDPCCMTCTKRIRYIAGIGVGIPDIPTIPDSSGPHDPARNAILSIIASLPQITPQVTSEVTQQVNSKLHEIILAPLPKLKDPIRRPRAKRAQGICQFPGCNRQAVTMGYCVTCRARICMRLKRGWSYKDASTIQPDMKHVRKRKTG